MRILLTIATGVLLVIGVVVGIAALGLAADANVPTLRPITVRAPATPPLAPSPAPAGQPPVDQPPVPSPAAAEQPPVPQLPRDPEGYVAPPPPVAGDDDDDDGDDDGDDDDD